jgi:hypothetical protein
LENNTSERKTLIIDNIFFTQAIFGILHLGFVSATIVYFCRTGNNLYNKSTILASIVMLGFMLSVFKHYILGAYAHLSYPYNTFLFTPDDRFNDFFNMLRACKDNNPYLTSYWLKSVYFPTANTFFYVFGLIRNEWFLLGIYTCVFFAVYLSYIKKNLFPKNSLDSIRDFIIIGFLTYPVLFNLDRANLDMYLFLLILGFVVFFQKGRFVLSSLFLSMAIAMKLYPGVFILLFFKEKKYKEIAITIATTLSISVVSLWSFHGGFFENLQGMLSVLQGFNQNYSGAHGLQHNVSYYGVLKLITVGYYYAVQGIHDAATVSMLTNEVLRFPYLVLVALIFAFVVYHVLKHEQILWKNVYLLSAAMILLPHVSFDYKLIHLLIPIILFLRDQHVTHFSNGYLVLFGIMLIPNNYLYIRGDISIAVIIYPIIITTLAILIIIERIMYQSNAIYKDLLNDKGI